MKQTGIIMSGDHPRKILDGTKSMTRRTYGLEKINDMPYIWGEPRYDEEVGMWLFWQQNTGDCIHIKCPYGHIGDRLVIKERWATENQYNLLKPSEVPRTAKIWYLADEQYDPFEMGIVRSAMFMCYWMSRARPAITGLRAERLQEITEADAKAEGWSEPIAGSEVSIRVAVPVLWFADLWDSLNAKRGYPWSGNWWVWVPSFKLVDKEIPC